ncbi:hypothetical protein BGW36DRAFT_387813 [Talaromyces proteolyticus]|uniref:Uncharacterized protein n=1 Tax=Talaromyces proteolyticus TaxID=1131652 RepID=A0AAD4PW61_9EURO|nr:uncharacterized protein BGW36DRAFT_387813 [Talaromyces proteolyticus]KAH8691179.1 hypothetical protein BGW36DRAFT_387813 [Talaromyces proteolyticus]
MGKTRLSKAPDGLWLQPNGLPGPVTRVIKPTQPFGRRSTSPPASQPSELPSCDSIADIIFSKPPTPKTIYFYH